MTKRDNFTQATINILMNRVANRCSKPDCRVPTTAPQGEDKVTKVRTAAHITAASKGGPRYDSTMTKEQRKSINNAIWLCNNHATEIDRDVKKYSVQLLHSWKKKLKKQLVMNLLKNYHQQQMLLIL